MSKFIKGLMTNAELLEGLQEYEKNVIKNCIKYKNEGLKENYKLNKDILKEVKKEIKHCEGIEKTLQELKEVF